MERCRSPWRVNDVDARAELVFVRKRLHKVEPATEINRELLERFPFILQIKAVEVAVLVVIIDDTLRRSAGLITVGVDRKNERGGVDGRVLFSENQTGANCVLVVELVARVQFDAVGKNGSIDARRDAVEDEIANVIRLEQN